MHFARKRRHPAEDLASTVNINGVEAELLDKSMRILGVWVDPKLQWKEHVQQAVRKSNAQLTALSIIAASTWGPAFVKTRLLYTAVVQPTILYGVQTWA